MERVKIMFSWVWGFILPFVKQLLTQAGPILAAAALSAVKATAANLSGATDAEKRNHAYGLIVNELTAQGIVVGTQVGVSMINAAIELAVMRSKEI